MNKYIVILILMITINCYAQPTIIRIDINGTINSNEFDTLIINKLGLPISGILNKYSIPIINNKFHQKIELPANCLFNLADGYLGHKIFFDINDSITFSLYIKPNLGHQIAKGKYFSKFHNLKVKAKYPGNFLFFDKLEEKIGSDIRYLNADVGKITALQYKNRCDKALMTSYTLLNEFKTKNLISEKFYEIARLEIENTYILWICDIGTNLERKMFSNNYFEKLDKIKFDNEDLIYQSDSYVIAASVFNIYYLNKFDLYNWYSNLENEYKSAYFFFKGLLRDKVLSSLLIDYKSKKHPKFDSLYSAFLTECNNSTIKANVIAEVNGYKNSRMSNPVINEILKTKLMDVAGKSYTLNDVSNKHTYIIIDCWATWCIPCIRQEKFLENFEKKYNKSILFLNLSIDSDINKWKKYVLTNKQGVKRDFLITDFQQSAFVKYFDLISIPRFIFLITDNNGLSSINMPFPEQTIAFEKYIVDQIKKDPIL